MYRASAGGGAAAHRVYRHALVRCISPLLGVLAPGTGWSPFGIGACAVLMSWLPAGALAQRFEQARGILDAALPRRRRVGRTYQGFIKALRRHSGALLAELIPHLRAESERIAGAHWRFGEFVPVAVDGSKFDAPRTRDNEQLGTAGKDKSGPQMMVAYMMNLMTLTPLAWRIGGARASERALFREMIDELPPEALLVADAGYTGYELLAELDRRGVAFLVRVGRAVRLLTALGYQRREGTDTVYLWPACHRKRRPLALRLIRVGRVHLITNVTDPRRLSRRSAGELYRRRWGIEVTFRTLKRTMSHLKMRTRTARHAKIELAWALVGMWVLRLLGLRAIVARHDPCRLGMAAALAAVRAEAVHAEARSRTPHALRGRLRKALIDAYQRRKSKHARGYARKKKQPTPGPPKLTRATKAQVAQAKALRTLAPDE